MSGAALVVHLPRHAPLAGLRWRVGIDGEWAVPGTHIPVRPGRVELTILVESAAPGGLVAARIRLPVHVAADGLTELRLHRSRALRGLFRPRPAVRSGAA